MNRRLAIFLAAAFGISWGAWGSLIVLSRMQAASYGHWPFMILYVLGGLGPTIAAYVALLATPRQAPLKEFHQRLLRWRVGSSWLLAAFGLPLLLAVLPLLIAILLKPALSAAVSIQPWYMLAPLFCAMIIGGGLEELGWRGIAQAEWQSALGPARAALLVGLVWAVWHAPLFLLPGVSQYHSNFAIFAVGVVGIAMILGWLYSHTGSILLCVVFHAASNALVAFGIRLPHAAGSLALLGPALHLLLGCVLLLTLRRTGMRAGAGRS